MSEELKLPKEALVNRFIAKTKFYEKANLNSKLQQEFIEKIQKITWKYKISESTVGISKTDKVVEIQVFEIELKEKNIPKNVLKVIDKSIPYHILYKFLFNDDFSYGITLKEENNVENYYFSEWNEDITFDFSGLDLEKVYHKLVKSFIKTNIDEHKDFKEVISIDNKIKLLQNEISILENKIKKEKQFNKKVELNKVLLEKKKFLQKFEM
jgi:uncharacterized protein (UPF0248 family)